MTEREYAAELASLRAKRVTLIKAFQSKLAEALIRLPAEDARWADIVAGLRLLSGLAPDPVADGESCSSAPTPLSILRPSTSPHERTGDLHRAGHHRRAAR